MCGLNEEICAKAQAVKLLVLDVDGVLTDGRLYFGSAGEMLKGFHVYDGMGITLARKAGISTAIITGRQSGIVAARAAELGIVDLYQGARDKRQAFQELLKKYELTAAQAAYMGDDLNDLPLLIQAGLALAPANAVPEVKARVQVVMQKPGGSGAVREALELILRAQGQWEQLVNSYMNAAYEVRQ